MRNWLGQQLAVGTQVYRGARRGDTSEYKVGVIQSFGNGKARVKWLYEHSSLWENVDRGAKWGNGTPRMDRDFVAYVPRKIDSAGNPGLDSLVALTAEQFAYVEAVSALVVEWHERLKTVPMAKQEFLDRLGEL